MLGLFQADLGFLFKQASVWRTLVETLLAITPLAIALSGYANWRIGDRQGLLLMAWVSIYLIWMLWPQPLAPALLLPGQMVSVLGWLWLVREWANRLKWHEPLLLAANGVVVTLLFWLVVIALVAALHNYLGRVAS
jgi:hypothetical protein